MTKLNPADKSSSDQNSKAHLNWMGGRSWDINDPFVRLRLAAASSFFGEPKYYDMSGTAKKNKSKRAPDIAASRLTEREFLHLKSMLNALSPYEWRNMTPRGVMEKCIDECLEVDIEKTLNMAVALRNDDYIRSTPQVILVRAAMHPKAKGTGLIRRYAKEICKRGDEPAAGLAYLFDEYGTNVPIPNALKRAWKEILESFSDYVISKYRMNDCSVKTIDVVNLVHACSEPIGRLARGEAKQEDTWNSIISNGDQSTPDKAKALWTKAAGVMPHMALLRNLRNLAQNGIETDLIKEKFENGVSGGKQLSFRYYTAYKMLEEYPSWQDMTEECLERSFENMPHFSGRVISLSDNSGSAWGTLTSEWGSMQVASIGNLMGVVTARCADEGYVGIFGDKLEVFPVRNKSSIFDLCDKADELAHEIGQSTENGIWLFFDQAIKKREHWDHIFIYSDMQAGHGGLYGIDASQYSDYIWPNSGNMIDVAKLIKEYRKINPNVLVYLVQTAGYTDTLVPEYYDRTFILGGWSANIIPFAAKMADIYTDKLPQENS